MSGSGRIQKIDPLDIEWGLIETAGKIIKSGGVVIFPTWGLYGLGCDALNPGAVTRLFDIKKRPPNKPILVLVQNTSSLKILAKKIPWTAKRLMDHFWPGRLTLIFEAQNHLSENLTAGTGKIGIRLSGHPVASALVSVLGIPITGTSANISGGAGHGAVSDIEPDVLGKIDFILDAGPLQGGVGSTIVDVTGSVPVVLREGAVARKEIDTVLAGPHIAY